MTRIAVVGYFGWGNVGDQLFLDTALRRREELWPGSSAVVSLTMQNLARHATFGPLGALLRALHTARIARNADVLAYCRGSVFREISGVDALRRRLRPARAQAPSVSVGPFARPGARQAVKDYPCDFERIVVRDDSWTLLHDIHPNGTERHTLEEGGDLAALGPLIDQAASRARESLATCPSAAAGVDVEVLATQVMQALLPLGRSARVRLLALNGHPRRGNIELVRALATAFRSRGVDCETSSFLDLGLEATVAALTSAGLVPSKRLHGANVAYLSGEFVMNDHHPKYIECAHRVYLERLTHA